MIVMITIRLSMKGGIADDLSGLRVPERRARNGSQQNDRDEDGERGPERVAQSSC
jgi:hypothetical protein